MCICICVCIYMCIHCIYVCTYVCVYVYMYAKICAYNPMSPFFVVCACGFKADYRVLDNSEGAHPWEGLNQKTVA